MWEYVEVGLPVKKGQRGMYTHEGFELFNNINRALACIVDDKYMYIIPQLYKSKINF
jgi:hypothetical protein